MCVVYVDAHNNLLKTRKVSFVLTLTSSHMWFMYACLISFVYLSGDKTIRVASHQKIGYSTHGGFTKQLESDDKFGEACHTLGGDLDNDGIDEFVVGSDKESLLNSLYQI